MKQRSKRLIALFLSLACMFTLLVACDEAGNITQTTEGGTTEGVTIQRTTAKKTTAQKTTAATTVATTVDTRMKLRIGSYNIAAGKKCSYNMSLFGADIKKYDLDIVGLQEVDYMTDRNKKQDTMKLISEASGLAHYAYFKAIDYQGGEYGLGILSKYPILATELIMLESGNKEQRILAHAVIDVDGVKFDFFVTHLTHDDTSLRNGQFKKLGEILANYHNFILTGDFNTTNFSDYNTIADAGMVNRKDNRIITFPSKGSCLDNIVYSKTAWQFDKGARHVSSHSDHYMLYAEATYLMGEEQ